MNTSRTSQLLDRPIQRIAEVCGVRTSQVTRWGTRGWAPIEHHDKIAQELGLDDVAELRRDVVAHKAQLKARRAAKVAK